MRREEIEMFVRTEIAAREIPDSMILFGIEPTAECVFQAHDEHTGYPIDAQICYLITKNNYGVKLGDATPIKYRHAVEFARRDSTDDIRTKVRAGVKQFEQWLQGHIPVCTLSKTGQCEC